MKKFAPIGFGTFGKEVEAIRKQLVLAGSTIKPTIGYRYTIGMFSAVKAFQKKNGLPATGVVDKPTWNKLMTVKPARKSRKK